MELKSQVITRILVAHILFSFVSLDALQAEEFHVTTAAEFQNALTAARDNGEADTIGLAAGVYNASDNNYAFTYIAKEGEDYDITIKGESGTTADGVILNGNGEYVVLDIKQGNAPIIIEGITARNGVEGIIISHSNDITLVNNIITENSNEAVYVNSSSGNVTLTGNTVVNNSGVAVYISHSGNITLINNTIKDNTGEGVCVYSYSGNTTLNNNIIIKNGSTGVYVYSDAFSSGDITLTNNTIRENRKSGVYVESGGSEYTFYASGNAILTNNIITDNMRMGLCIDALSLVYVTLTNNIITSNMDGGAFIVNGTDDVIISRNIIRKNGDSGVYFSSSESSITLTNNTITENTADGNGGGIFINSVYSDGVTTLTNNTIIGNKASQNGGGFYLICPEEDNIAYIYNNIIWGNEGAEGGDIYYDSHIYSVANLYNNNFHDIEGSPFTEDVDNIDNDPLLVNPEQGDYHLLADSPCIDKGTANAPELPATDFEGDPRIIGIAPDIGADEYDPTAPPTSTSTTTTIPITTTIALTSTTTILSTTTTPADSTTTTTIDGSCTSGVIYGEHSEETELLRYFRDNVLSQTPEGQELIELYYQWSPVIVKAMEEDEEFKEDIKEMIDGILPLIGKEIE